MSPAVNAWCIRCGDYVDSNRNRHQCLAGTCRPISASAVLIGGKPGDPLPSGPLIAPAGMPEDVEKRSVLPMTLEAVRATWPNWNTSPLLADEGVRGMSAPVREYLDRKDAAALQHDMMGNYEAPAGVFIPAHHPRCGCKLCLGRAMDPGQAMAVYGKPARAPLPALAAMESHLVRFQWAHSKHDLMGDESARAWNAASVARCLASERGMILLHIEEAPLFAEKARWFPLRAFAWLEPIADFDA